MWRIGWLRSWAEVWDRENLSRWEGAFAPGSGAAVNPFMHPDVVRAWLKAHEPKRFDPFFLDARHPDGRRALLLLVRSTGDWQNGFVRRLVPVGEREFDYHRPIVLPSGSGATALDAGFWSTLLAEIHRHSGQWYDTCEINGLSEPCLAKMPGSVPLEASHILRLDGYADSEAYLASRSKKLRKDLRRSERLLAEGGTLRFVVHPPEDVAAVERWLPRFLSERLRRYPPKATPEWWSAFAGNLVRLGMPSGIVHCSSMWLDDRSISWEINLQHNGVLYGYLCGFAAGYERCSVGSLHLFKLLERLIADGVESYDFMSGGEAYKGIWTDGEAVPVYRLAFASPAPVSHLRRNARRAIQGVGRRLPPFPSSVNLPGRQPPLDSPVR